MQWLETMTPENVLYQPNLVNAPSAAAVPDNIFAAEFNDDWPNPPLGANDALLTFTPRMEGAKHQETPVIQHD